MPSLSPMSWALGLALKVVMGLCSALNTGGLLLLFFALVSQKALFLEDQKLVLHLLFASGHSWISAVDADFGLSDVSAAQTQLLLQTPL